jgi:hypothetical protein
LMSAQLQMVSLALSTPFIKVVIPIIGCFFKIFTSIY